MSFFGILGTIFIGPLKLIFEIIFSLANNIIGHPGLAIIALSLVMNFLVLPLYRRADAMQEQARDVENRLKPGIDHIKKTFSGDERMMMLQTYYRQNDYSPLNALHGSVSLLLEIPFFIAAYQFLSHVACLQGVSLGPVSDLGAPDGMLRLGGLAINLLPILMTLINVVSSAVYAKGFPLKTKVQLYGVALIFLVFLYNSPAGLVFYWTLNNVFSLVKNLFYKLKNPRLVLCIMAFAAGLAALVFGLFVLNLPTMKLRLFFAAMGLALMLPLLWLLIRPRLSLPESNEPTRTEGKLFLAGSLFLTVLIGLLIPSTFIAASPQEFVDVNYFHDPLNYLVMSAALAVGFFLVWLRVFYWLAGDKFRRLFEHSVWLLAVLAAVDYMFFGTKLGVISPQLQYEVEMNYAAAVHLLNLGLLLALGALLYLAGRRWQKLPRTALSLGCAAMLCMSLINVFGISGSVKQLNTGDSAQAPQLSLSREGKNVIVLMLDRALGQAVPYIMNERPELEEKFDGFTYYSNALSHGGHTNFGTPGLFGGYEYTPVEMNRREDESLVSKHNEALLVMPRIFSGAGYAVTVCDPIYANYQWVPDLSIYDAYPGIDAYITQGYFVDDAQKQVIIDNNYRNFFCFGLMRCLPTVLQDTLYDGGNYHQVATVGSTPYTQVVQGVSKATGYTSSFIASYSVLENLPGMTRISDEGAGSFIMMVNDATHQPILLQEPDYEPAAVVDNSGFDKANAGRFTLEGVTLRTDNSFRMAHYHVNMASFLKLGEWFDYLREQGVYDNTRIILVSDHGTVAGMHDELIMGENGRDVAPYFPLLMVKDFDSHGFDSSAEFMTNADVPTLAMDGLIENPVNPFSGKAISSDEKTAHKQFVTLSTDWGTGGDRGNVFGASGWASVSDNIWDEDNWSFYEEETVLKEHEIG